MPNFEIEILPGSPLDIENHATVKDGIPRTMHVIAEDWEDALVEGQKAYKAFGVGVDVKFLRWKATEPSLGLKYDASKPRYDLLPFDAIEGVAQVLTFGAAKYAPNNWQKVENGKDRYLAALLRHVSALAQGHLVDEESSLPVVDHIATNALFLGHLYRANEDCESYAWGIHLDGKLLPWTVTTDYKDACVRAEEIRIGSTNVEVRKIPSEKDCSTGLWEVYDRLSKNTV